MTWTASASWGWRAAASIMVAVRSARLGPHELGVVGQQAQCLRRPAEHPRDVSAGAEDVRQPGSDRSFVAQQPQVPRRLSHLLGHLAVGQQPTVGVRSVGQLAEQHREQRALQAGAARDAGGEGVDVPQRGGRIAEAERGQSTAGLVGREPERLGRHAGDRLQQRAIEQLLVQAPHLAGVQSALGVPHRPGVASRVRPKAHAAGEPLQFRVLGGQQVRAAQPVQLQPVFGGPQEDVGVAQAERVVAPDVATVAQGRQRRAACPVPAAPRRPGRGRVAATAPRTPRRAGRPRPSLSSRSTSSGGTWANTRRRMARTSSTKSGRSAAVHTSGAMVST